MNPRRNVSQVGRQQGVGLVEIMVTLVIGLVILTALGYFFLGSRQTNRTHDEVSRMQESGRYAMEVIGKAIRQAGYRLDVRQELPAAAMQGTEGGGLATDAIILRHDPVWVGLPGNLLGNETNCAGELIISNNALQPSGEMSVNQRLVEYNFDIVAGAGAGACSAGQSCLRCRTVSPTGANSTAFLADNIENMQIDYGVDTNWDGIIDSYQTAAGVANFAQVSAVRVSLLVRGNSPNIATGEQNYFFNGQNLSSNDGFLRQVYTSTFTVRNQVRR